MQIQEGITALNRIFDRYPIQEVHHRSHKILRALGQEPDNLPLFIKYFLRTNYAYSREVSITGDFTVPLYNNHRFTLELGVFSPYDSRYSYATMHNHDDVQLSTLNLFGEGYYSVIFRKGHYVQKDGTVLVEPAVCKLHAPGNMEYIPEDTIHSVFYPESLTFTLTLWSSSRATGNTLPEKYYRWNKRRRSAVKRRELLREHGISRAPYALQDWFYPAEDGYVYPLPYSVKAPPGNHFVHNFLYKLQQIRFPDPDHILEFYAKQTLSAVEQESVAAYRTGQPLALQHTGDQMITPRRNVPLEHYQRCFPQFNFHKTKSLATI